MSLKKMRVLVTPSIQRAADLRGIPVNLWMQGVLLQAALRDIVEARDILEGAGFANRSYRLEQERKWREPQPPKQRLPKKKEKLARIAVVPAYEDERYAAEPAPTHDWHGARLPTYDESDPAQASRHVDHTRFHGPHNPCGYPVCDHCYPPAAAD